MTGVPRRHALANGTMLSPRMTTAPIFAELAGVTRVGLASLIGLAVGLEREWSGHASGRRARFAGLRTFMMLGMLGGLAGVLSARDHTALGAILIAGGVGIAATTYAIAALATSDLDGTTEVAAAIVVALGATAGTGWLMLSSAAGAIVVVALSEKQRLHGLVNAIGAIELSAGLQFAALAVVVLPLLPRGPIFGPLAIRPRALWTIVLALCALNFAGYIARRAVGARQGYGIAGALGGLLSSTAVTLAYARRSRAAKDDASALAIGVIAACTVLVPRVLVVSATLQPAVALAAAPYLLPMLGAGILLGFTAPKRKEGGADTRATDRSPLRFLNALQMAIGFQLALSAITWLRPRLGEVGLYGAAVALGLTDMDALTISMSSRASQVDPSVGARALAIGLLANTLFKLGIALVLGGSGFRPRVAAGLATLAAVLGGALVLL